MNAPELGFHEVHFDIHLLGQPLGGLDEGTAQFAVMLDSEGWVDHHGDIDQKGAGDLLEDILAGLRRRGCGGKQGLPRTAPPATADSTNLAGPATGSTPLRPLGCGGSYAFLPPWTPWARYPRQTARRDVAASWPLEPARRSFQPHAPLSDGITCARTERTADRGRMTPPCNATCDNPQQFPTGIPFVWSTGVSRSTTSGSRGFRAARRYPRDRSRFLKEHSEVSVQRPMCLRKNAVSQL
jgi:hypothetical protein